MVRIRVRNRLINHDPVRDARLYLNPTVNVYPLPAPPPAADAVTNRFGIADLNISGLNAGTHQLWIVPEHATAAEVGPQTARGITGGPPDRIFRGLHLTITVRVEGGQRRVTNAVVDHATRSNGTCTLQGNSLDVRLQPVWMRSPKSGGRGGDAVDMIIIHRTGGGRIGPAINTFLNDSEPQSCHYIIDVDGQVVKMVLDESTANQAGPSRWGSQTGLNSRSIGIENVNGGGDFSEEQYRSLLRLIGDLSREHSILSHRIVGHSDIATDDAQRVLSNRRVACPGPQFDWPRLEQAGFGLERGRPASNISYYFGGFFTESPNGAFQRGDRDDRRRFGGREMPNVIGTPVEDLQTFLRNIGYSVDPDGDYGNQTERAVFHFQTHFAAGTGNGPNPDGRANSQTANLIWSTTLRNPAAP